METLPPDAELDELTLVRAQRGERAAAGALVERYQQRVFALLSRLVGRAGPVEDLAQETFIRALGALPRFDRTGPARLSTWLLTIATRLALDSLRRIKPSEPLDAHLELAGPGASDPHTRLLLQSVARAAAALGPDFRAAFLLREAHGLSYEEVAEALQIDVGTAKSRVSRAKTALRAALEVDDV